MTDVDKKNETATTGVISSHRRRRQRRDRNCTTAASVKIDPRHTKPNSYTIESNAAWNWWIHQLKPSGWIKFVYKIVGDDAFIPVQYSVQTTNGKKNEMTTNKLATQKQVLKYGQRGIHYAVGWLELYNMIQLYGKLQPSADTKGKLKHIIMDYKGPPLHCSKFEEDENTSPTLSSSSIAKKQHEKENSKLLMMAMVTSTAMTTKSVVEKTRAEEAAPIENQRSNSKNTNGLEDDSTGNKTPPGDDKEDHHHHQRRQQQQQSSSKKKTIQKERVGRSLKDIILSRNKDDSEKSTGTNTTTLLEQTEASKGDGNQKSGEENKGSDKSVAFNTTLQTAALADDQQQVGENKGSDESVGYHTTFQTEAVEDDQQPGGANKDSDESVGNSTTHQVAAFLDDQQPGGEKSSEGIGSHVPVTSNATTTTGDDSRTGKESVEASQKSTSIKQAPAEDSTSPETGKRVLGLSKNITLTGTARRTQEAAGATKEGAPSDGVRRDSTSPKPSQVIDLTSDDESNNQSNKATKDPTPTETRSRHKRPTKRSRNEHFGHDARKKRGIASKRNSNKAIIPGHPQQSLRLEALTLGRGRLQGGAQSIQSNLSRRKSHPHGASPNEFVPRQIAISKQSLQAVDALCRQRAVSDKSNQRESPPSTTGALEIANKISNKELARHEAARKHALSGKCTSPKYKKKEVEKDKVQSRDSGVQKSNNLRWRPTPPPLPPPAQQTSKRPTPFTGGKKKKVPRPQHQPPPPPLRKPVARENGVESARISRKPPPPPLDNRNNASQNKLLDRLSEYRVPPSILEQINDLNLEEKKRKASSELTVHVMKRKTRNDSIADGNSAATSSPAGVQHPSVPAAGTTATENSLSSPTNDEEELDPEQLAMNACMAGFWASYYGKTTR